uniref:Uncharacterized protein n=1 Tax=Romanomermis culicivorax TaxID=13658 RepID=A0A915IZK4_ROMCU
MSAEPGDCRLKRRGRLHEAAGFSPFCAETHKHSLPGEFNKRAVVQSLTRYEIFRADRIRRIFHTQIRHFVAERRVYDVELQRLRIFFDELLQFVDITNRFKFSWPSLACKIPNRVTAR